MTSENDKRTITFIAAPGIEQKFDTVQSLKAFFKKEWDEHWEPILLPGFFNGLNQSIVNRLYETQAYLLDGLKPNYDKIQALDENSSNDDINKIFDFFSSDRQNFRGLVSLNPDDATILSFKNSNKIAALMGVVIRTKGYLRNTLRRINQEDVVRECFKGIAEFSASINTTPIFQQVWESLFTLADQERSIVKSDVESWISKIQKQHDAFTEALNLAYENFHKSRETQNKQNQLLNEVMQNHTLALNEITAKYNEHMKLEAPVTYWMAKVDELKKTRDDAFKQFRNTAIYVAIIAAALTILALRMIPNKELLLTLVPAGALFVIPAIWILRHMARTFTEAQVDMRDAALRAVQTKTYLAMVSSSTEKEEKLVALNALFRPGPGQPAEDGIPLPLIELLKRP